MSRDRDNVMAKVRRFEKAVMAISWIGSQPPEDHEEIKEEYKRTKKALFHAIDILLNNQKQG